MIPEVLLHIYRRAFAPHNFHEAYVDISKETSQDGKDRLEMGAE